MQVDGQPVDPNHWFQKNPYEATLKEIDPEGGWKTIAWSSLFPEDRCVRPDGKLRCVMLRYVKVSQVKLR